MRAGWLAVALGTLLLGCEPATLEVGDAWIRMPPPGSPSAAAYLTLKNNEAVGVRLTGARSDAFSHAMVHATVTENDVTRMVHATPMDIAPGQRVDFRPGGLHLMLMRPQRELHQGDRIELTLEFAERDALRFVAEVRRDFP